MINLTPRDEEIRRRWIDLGQSQGIISKALDLTRSAVAGIISRRGWVRNVAKPLTAIPYPERKRSPRARKMLVKPKGAPLKAAEAYDGPPIPLEELRPSSCRWIEGEPSDGFCGRQREIGSYCARHAAKAVRAA